MNEIETSDIKQIEIEINFYKEQTAQNIIEIGKRLIKAKKILPHGEWLPWLENKVEFSTQTANKFMKVANEMPYLSTSRNLSASKIYELLSLPVSEREEFIESNPIEDMTTRELRQAIKEKKELEKQIKELKSREPKIIEKEIIKEVKVYPSDYEELKNKVSQLHDIQSRLQDKVDREDYDKLRKEYSEKVNQIHELKEQLEQSIKQDSKTRHREKLKDSALVFCTRVHTFLNDVGGLAWLTEYIDELDDYDKRSYFKALDLLEGWILTVKANINKEEF